MKLVCSVASIGLITLVQAVFGEPGTTHWGFLVRDNPATGFTPAELQEMQAAHLGNFRRLAEAGPLIAAGPLGDPEGKLRGIVILNLSDGADTEAMFEPDPFVTKGLLDLQLAKLESHYGQLRASREPEMETVTLARIKRLDERTSEAPDSVGWDQLQTEGQLLFGGQLEDGQWVLVFKSTDLDQVNKGVRAALGESSSEWSIQVMPLYVGKGVFPGEV